MAKPASVIGWKLDRTQRADLLERFPPRYADTIADHVTLKTDAMADHGHPSERKTDLARIQRNAGSAKRCHHAAPVSIFSEQRGFHES